MSYVYAQVDRGSIEWADVSHAERVLEEARWELDLRRPLHIRWYVRDLAGFRLTRYGRALDVADERHLAGWRDWPHCEDCGAYISVRADRPRAEIGLTVAHEAFHLWQQRHDKPLDEIQAEAFARRLVARIEGEAA